MVPTTQPGGGVRATSGAGESVESAPDSVPVETEQFVFQGAGRWGALTEADHQQTSGGRKLSQPLGQRSGRQQQQANQAEQQAPRKSGLMHHSLLVCAELQPL